MQPRSYRHLMLYIGIAGLMMAVLLVALGLYLQGSPPDSGASDDSPKPEHSAPPPKEPPLNR